MLKPRRPSRGSSEPVCGSLLLSEPEFEFDCEAAFGSVEVLEALFWSLMWFGEEADEPLLFMSLELELCVPVVLVAEFWLLDAAPAAAPV